MEYNANYSKTDGSVRQYYRDELVAALVNSESFRFKTKVARRALAAVNSSSEIAVSSKHLSKFWRTL